MKHASALILAALWLSACGDPNTTANNTPAGECERDADCASPAVCRVAICTVAATDERQLGFRLTPPPSSSYPPQAVPIRPIPPDTPVQIGIDPGVRVAGTLSWVGSEAGPGTGRLRLKQRGGDFATEAAVELNKYEAYVPAGEYDITFFPSDEAQPTRVWTQVKISLDTDPLLQIVRETVEIIGTLSRTDAMTRESNPVTGARVFATSDTTQITSSVAVTDDSGNFRIAVPPDSGLFDLHVAPAEPNTYAPERAQAAYVPDATFAGAFTVDDRAWTNLLDENGADVLGVSLGEYTYAPTNIPFRLVYSDGEALDWTGTTVTLRTVAGRGVVSVRQRLEASGEFSLPLVLGAYDAVVRTPAALPAASLEVSNLELDAQGITLRLEPRERVVGEVVGPDGAPAPAELRLSPLRPGSLAEQVNVGTDDAGRYELWLEDEPYLLTVVPTSPTLPMHVRTVDGEIPSVLELPEPVLVWGTVLGTPGDMTSDDWERLPDVNVHVTEADTAGVERVIGEAQTNEKGEFKVLVARP